MEALSTLERADHRRLVRIAYRLLVPCVALGCGGTFTSDDSAGVGAGAAGGASDGGSAGDSASGSSGAGGTDTNGGSASGGTSMGGAPSGGGITTGGVSSGGAGGAVTGGTGGAMGGIGGTAAGGDGAGGTGGSTGGVGTGGTGGTGGAPTCSATSCSWDCCDGQCVNRGNDIDNCGQCGHACTEGQPYCDNGTCGQPPCDAPIICAANSFCCGSTCCQLGKLCCSIPGPIAIAVECVEPTESGTCPTGCNLCACNPPETRIATPLGDRRISELRDGDLVYSVHRGAVVAVPIALVTRKSVEHHQIARVTLATGVTLSASAGHPTADGRTLGDLGPGDVVDGLEVTRAERLPYEQPFTYDILPDSDTGTYYAEGVLLGSTLNEAGAVAAPGSAPPTCH